ncbi:MAG: DNA cytosine methyltransferase [Candidatus Aureabacteria bacterium]|nr:DNA cytosine methyltransferase [Candidatus Auribacterota bacterium]
MKKLTKTQDYNMNKNKTILSLCSGTGAWESPYVNAGYNVISITLPQHDVTTYIPPDNVYGILAAPPCTEFSIVRNRDIFKDFDGAMKIVNACLNIIKMTSPVFWALENPIGYLSTFLNKPRFSFQPYEFGDAWTKRTQIWGDFTIPHKTHTWALSKKIQELYIRPGRDKPSMACLHKSQKKYMPGLSKFSAKTDAEFRAMTPQGFAQAFYKANK